MRKSKKPKKKIIKEAIPFIIAFIIFVIPTFISLYLVIEKDMKEALPFVFMLGVPSLILMAYSMEFFEPDYSKINNGSVGGISLKKSKSNYKSNYVPMEARSIRISEDDTGYVSLDPDM